MIVDIPKQEDNKSLQQKLLSRGGQLVEDIIGDVMPQQSSETSFELNLAMFKFKHSVKREKNDEITELKEKMLQMQEEIVRLRGEQQP